MIEFWIVKQHRCNTHSFQLEVSTQLEAGQMLGIQGPSGCGKTTLLRCLAGLECPDAGFIQADNRYWYRDAPYCQLSPGKRKTAYMFPDYALFPHMTVVQNLLYAGAGDSCRELLEMVELSDYGMRFPHELSSGQQQRVALARTVAQPADLLLLDEPFSALDEELRERVSTRIGGIQRARNVKTIMVSHSLSELDRMCDRVLML